MRMLTLAALTLTLCACGGNPPPEREPRTRSLRQTGEEAKAPPKGIEAPIDQWRASLEEQLPTPWKLAKVEQQIESPPGWTRFKGSRGLKIELSNGTLQQAFWIMPASFSGRKTEKNPAAACGQNEEFVLYRPASLTAGFQHTPEVRAALGM